MNSKIFFGLRLIPYAFLTTVTLKVKINSNGGKFNSLLSKVL